MNAPEYDGMVQGLAVMALVGAASDGHKNTIPVGRLNAEVTQRVKDRHCRRPAWQERRGRYHGRGRR